MSNLHVIIGEDDYLVEQTAKKTVGDGIGLEVVDSCNSTNAELQLRDLREADASFSTPPFLDPRKVTWWKNVNFLPGAGGRDLADEVKEALEKFAVKLASAKLPENQHFILSAKSWLKTSIFAKTISAAAEVVVFSAPKPWEAERQATARAIEMAAEQGLRFAPGAAEAFVSVVGSDMRSLCSEVIKLRDYLGPDRNVITTDDVRDVTSPGVRDEAVPWDVTDAIGRRDAAAALRALRAFELENGFAVFLSGVIERFFRQLLDVKLGRAGEMSAFVLKKNQGFAANWSEAELRRARLRFLDLREKVVSGATAGDVLVVTELLRAMRRAGRR